MTVELYQYSIRIQEAGFVIPLLGRDMIDAKAVPVYSKPELKRPDYWTVVITDIWGNERVLDLRKGIITNQPTWTNNSGGAAQCIIDLAPIIRMAPMTGEVVAKNSIEIDNGELQLVGDLASPGADLHYATDGSGVRGWYANPTGGGLDVTTNPGWVTIPDGLGSGVFGYIPITDSPS